MSPENSDITNFFSNQTIFLTGGTGIVGTLLIEKLLRTCWDIKKIYVLLRPKHSKSSEERFENLLKNSCFSRIKARDLKSKLALIDGDFQLPFFGLKPEDQEVLKNETTVVFHAGANVKINQTLKDASYNVRATQDILQLVKQMTNLKVFVYVSTAYSNCIYGQIDEKFYKPPISGETFLDFVNSVDNLEKIAPTLLGCWPNAYVYSKSICEDLINRSNLEVPTAVVRPSIINSTVSEPVPGWFLTPVGLIGIACRAWIGVVSSFYATKKTRIDFVAADHVCNFILAAAWKLSTESGTKIYNCVGEKQTLERVLSLIHDYYWEFSSEKYFWYKTFRVTENKFWHEVLVVWNLVRNEFIDLVLVVLGKKRRAVNWYTKMNNGMNLVSYFGTNEWNFETTNIATLWTEMSEVDKKTFPFNVKISDWDVYFRNCASGIRKFLLNESIETVPKSRNKVRILFVVHYLYVAFLFYLFYVFLNVLFKCLKSN